MFDVGILFFVVLYPQLRTTALYQLFDLLHAVQCLLLVEVKGRNAALFAVAGEVVQIPGQNNAPALGQIQIQ